MKFYSPLLSDCSDVLEQSAICIGNFDGLHLGHAELFKVLKKNKGSLRTGVLSFAPHPKKVLDRDSDLKYLTPLRKKVELLREFDFFYAAHFTKSFANLSPAQFINDFLIKRLNPKLVVVGFDWKFAKAGAGEHEFLRNELEKHECKLIVVPAVLKDDIRISSSLLKECLENADLDGFKKFTARNFEILARVVEGEARGRELGFRTANLDIKDQFLPKRGVYKTLATVAGKTYPSVTNVGIKPTFNSSTMSVETHVIGRDDLELYGQFVNLSFLKFIREEVKFNSKEELVSQIKEDIKNAS